MADIDFGHMVSPTEAMLADNPQEGPQPQTAITSQGNTTWEYHELGRVNGIPVADEDRNLPIDRDDLIDAAFTLKRTPGSKIFWMSPEDADSIKLYDDILHKQADGELQILEELKQYDPGKGKFIVWLRYDELQCVLNPRFDYLREELK